MTKHMNLAKTWRPLALALAMSASPGLAQTPPASGGTREFATKFLNYNLKVSLAPLPERFETPDNPVTPDKVALGRMLYYEARLSKNHDVSCNSCHDLAKGGVDGTPVSTGHRKQQGGRNAPTVYNAAGHAAQFWDGRAPTVEEQAKGPILNPIEMAMPSKEAAVATLKSMPGYVEAFKKAFPGEADPVTYDNVGKAIGAFERNLVTPSRYDTYLRGDDKALTEAEQQGLRKFVEVGCALCHNGPLLGGGFMRLGWLVSYPNQKDLGLFEQTHKDKDKMIFRVPTLRNITRTAPYFHDGSVKDVQTAVKLMGQHQLMRELSDAEVSSIVTFLETLKGEVPPAYIARPTLPPSGPETPKPDPN